MAESIPKIADTVYVIVEDGKQQWHCEPRRVGYVEQFTQTKTVVHTAVCDKKAKSYLTREDVLGETCFQSEAGATFAMLQMESRRSC